MDWRGKTSEKSGCRPATDFPDLPLDRPRLPVTRLLPRHVELRNAFHHQLSEKTIGALVNWIATSYPSMWVRKVNHTPEASINRNRPKKPSTSDSLSIRRQALMGLKSNVVGFMVSSGRHSHQCRVDWPLMTDGYDCQMTFTPTPKRRGLTRIWHATRYSLNGLQDGWREPAFRQELVQGAVLLPTAWVLGRNWVETALLIAVLVLVLVVELLNTAIESVVDRVGPEWHALSKRAKDLGSAAVLLSLLLCTGVWLAAAVHRWLS